MPWGLHSSSHNSHGLNHHSNHSSAPSSAPPSHPTSPALHPHNPPHPGIHGAHPISPLPSVPTSRRGSIGYQSSAGSGHNSLSGSRQSSIALPRPAVLALHATPGSSPANSDALTDFYASARSGGGPTPWTPGHSATGSGFGGASEGDHYNSNPSTPSVASSYSNSYFNTQQPTSGPGGSAGTPGCSMSGSYIGQSLRSVSNISAAHSLPSAHSYHAPAPQHLEINLEQDHLIMRGVGVDTTPCLLAGEVVLNLTDSSSIREVDLKLEGRAKVAFQEGNNQGTIKSHHHTHVILSHDWSLLQGAKNHAHTLKAGRHAFPFSYTFEGALPSTVHTYANDVAITYKLKATAVRSTFQSNFHASKNVNLVRGYTNEALEYNQTLEIENTWPGKVMYCLTLPHKAFAAGDEIPVSIKFMPLAKGTRVTSINSIVKEYSTVHTRHSTHQNDRVAASTKHELREGKAYRVNERGSEAIVPPAHFHRDGHGDDLTSAPPSAPPSPNHRPQRDYGLGHVTPLSDGSLSRVGSMTNLSQSPYNAVTPSASRNEAGGYFGNGSGSGPSGSSVAGPSNGTGNIADIPDDLRERELNIGDEEIDTMITIPLPAWTTPSHNVYPVFVTHKIKWSCSISNPDGHVSELRCALPITILPNSLLTEAQAATSATRNLLFGGGDAEVQVVDLPSYNDHVYDRIAGMAPGSSTLSYVTSGHRTPAVTPPHSRGPSRPASPTRGMSQASYRGHHTPETPEGEDAADVPERPDWADSELLLSLGALASANNSPHPTQMGLRSSGSSPHETPSESRTPSRPGSRLGFRTGRSSQPNSRPNSRPGSRASSPERPPSVHTIHAGTGGSAVPPSMTRGQSHGLPCLFHLPHALKPLSSVRQAPSRGGSSTNLAGLNTESPRPAHSANAGLSRSTFSLGSQNAFSQVAQNAPRAPPGGSMTPPTDRPLDPLSQVPSYAIASRGFLGGGVVPLSTGPPQYLDSESLERTRSEGALDQMVHNPDALDPASLAAAMERLNAIDARRAPVAFDDPPSH